MPDATTILVLDDRQADRDLLATVLGYGGHDVLLAATADEALLLARDRRPDVVITDILMPRINGYEFARRLRDDPRTADLPVVFCTANYAEGEVRTLAQACGVSRFLEKPYRPNEVLELVAEIVGSEAPVLTVPHTDEEFEREQLRLLNDKLVEKVEALEKANAERVSLLDQLMRAHEDERRRICEEIHDDSIQTVLASGLQLDALRERTAAPEAAAAFATARASVVAAADRLRRLLFDLRPAELETEGVAAVLRTCLQQAQRDTPIAHRVDGDLPDSAPAEVRVMLFRAAQEALMNVRKHAGASHLVVELGVRDGRYSVTVTDDGRGFDPKQALQVRPGHLGLPALRERLRGSGGWIDVQSAPGRGARITIELPILHVVNRVA